MEIICKDYTTPGKKNTSTNEQMSKCECVMVQKIQHNSVSNQQKKEENEVIICDTLAVPKNVCSKIVIQ